MKVHGSSYESHFLSLFQAIADYLPYSKSLLKQLQQSFAHHPSEPLLQVLVSMLSGVHGIDIIQPTEPW